MGNAARKARKRAGEKLEPKALKKPTGKYVSRKDAKANRRDEIAAEQMSYELARSMAKWPPSTPGTRS